MGRRVVLAFALAALLGGPLGGEEARSSSPGQVAGSPLAPEGEPVRQARQATVVFSDGRKRVGHAWLTPGKRLKIYERAREKYLEFSLEDVLRIDVDPEKEKLEPVWRWREHASDEKVSTGEAYPWRQYVTTVRLRDRQAKVHTVTGDMTALLYFQEDLKKPSKLTIHRRHKGEVGQALQDLVYVTAVIFEEEKKDEVQ